MTAKWVGDALGKDGIYSVWIAMRRYPWLPPIDYRDQGESATSIMRPVSRIISIIDGTTTVRELRRILGDYRYHGFPVVDPRGEFVGYATRQELQAALDRQLSHASEESLSKTCTFSKNRLRIAAEERMDLSNALEDSIIQLRKEVPQELVVNMFRKLVRKTCCVL